MCFKSKLLVAVALLSSALSSVLLGQGSISFKTSLEVSGMYERNPWLLSDEEKKDQDYVDNESYVVQYSPRIGIDYRAGLGDFHLRYEPYYKTYHTSGRKNYSIKPHVGSFSGEIYFTDRLSLALRDSFSDSAVGTESWSDDSGLDARYFANSASEIVQYTPGAKLVLTIGHRSSGSWYRREENRRRDREENFALASVGYKLGWATEVGVTGDWGLIDCETLDVNDDRYKYSARGYVNRTLDAIDTDVRAEAGVVTTEYKDDREGASSKKSSFAGSLSVKRDLRENTRASVTATSDYKPSDDLGGGFYLSTSIDTSVHHVFFDRIEAILGGRAQRRRYEYEKDSERRDYVYRVSATAGYKLTKWLSLRAGYTFAKVDSTIQTYEYDNQVVHASVYFEYSFSR